MARGGGLNTLYAVVGLGIAGIFLYDLIISPRCKHIIPVFDMMDTTCLLAGDKRAGLIMNPAGVPEWLRSIQRSAEEMWNRATGKAWTEAQGRGGQPVRSFTEITGIQPKGVAPRITTTPSTGRSGAPIDLQSRFPSSGPKPRIITARPTPTPKVGGRPAPAAESPLSLRNVFRGLGVKPGEVSRAVNEYFEFLKRGGGLGVEEWFRLGRPSWPGGLRGIKPIL
jgi:hypothetical protein